LDILITNNILVKEAYEKTFKAVYAETDFAGVLQAARDFIHKGHKLLSHPLSGSLKPNENPYKSILISSGADVLDLASLKIIENCIATVKNFPLKYIDLDREILRDFQKIDLSLISGALRTR